MPSIDDYSYHLGYERAINLIFISQVETLCNLIKHYPHLWKSGDGYGGYVRAVLDKKFYDYGFPDYQPAPKKVPNRRPISKSKLIAVMQKSDSKCVACGSSGELHVDHIIPHSRGGSNEIDNLQMLCAGCNLSKGTKTMEEWQGDAE
jgi:hypothetical protein